MRFLRNLALLGGCLAAAHGQALAAPAVYYVAVDGDDGNDGTKGHPFASVARARDEVRKRIAGGLKTGATVWVRGGTYRLGQTVVFGPEDSGTKSSPIVYRALAGEAPVLSGGRRITGWTSAGGGRWKATTDLADFRQLYVNGERRPRARGPALPGAQHTGSLQAVDAEGGYLTTKAEMAGWKNPADIEVGYFSEWSHMISKVKAIRRDPGGKAYVVMQQPGYYVAHRKEGRRADLPDYVENAFELMDEPGEWYLDKPAHTLYVIPRAGEDLEKAEVVAPVLERLVELKGTVERPVQHIRFEGLTFAEAGWILPNREGLADYQSLFVPNPGHLFERDGNVAPIHNETLKSPANVALHAASAIRFERCTFTRLGGAGLDIESGSQDNVISGCTFADISGSGLQVGDVLESDHHPKDPRLVVKNNQITNNYIHDIGVEYEGGTGVFVGYTDGTLVAHNEIARVPYVGVSVGWGWGEEDAGGGAYKLPFLYDTPSSSKNNRIEANHVSGACSKRTDCAGIYTLGRQPGTVIARNVVRSVREAPPKRTGNAAIYMDEGSAHIDVVENVVLDVAPPVIKYNNRAQKRNTTCREIGNFLNVKPGEPLYPEKIVAHAGREPAYRK